ncbi:MAG: DUF1272 domain-containing protein [Zoogloea sp.]|nr:MAG: DUF1272 domain-containing protein [Zoogloea sp.]
MLELRPGCECCNRDLPPESTEARICSFECSFCASCAESKLGGMCPNCGGQLVRRPQRPAAIMHRVVIPNPSSIRGAPERSASF